MFGMLRLWLKLVVAIALLIGCNVVAPAISASVNPAIMTSDMPCHEHRGKSDALPGLCGKACLAIPATTPAVAVADPPPAPHFAVAPSVFTSQTASPDTPPPRFA